MVTQISFIMGEKGGRENLKPKDGQQNENVVYNTL